LNRTRGLWQTWDKGTGILTPHQIRLRQKGDTLEVISLTRGTHEFEEGGYLWRGERLLGNST
jgi:hypothetical protein